MRLHRKSRGKETTNHAIDRKRLNGKATVKIVADMAADLFHAGHVAFLTKIRALFPLAHLTVWLATDEQILSYKGRLPVMSYACRKAVLESCRLVDDVAQAPEVYTSAALAPFDHLCHGDDLLAWDDSLKERFYGAAMRERKLVTVPYTGGISTTSLIAQCKKRVEMQALAGHDAMGRDLGEKGREFANPGRIVGAEPSRRLRYSRRKHLG